MPKESCVFNYYTVYLPIVSVKYPNIVSGQWIQCFAWGRGHPGFICEWRDQPLFVVTKNIPLPPPRPKKLASP